MYKEREREIRKSGKLREMREMERDERLERLERDLGESRWKRKIETRDEKKGKIDTRRKRSRDERERVRGWEVSWALTSFYFIPSGNYRHQFMEIEITSNDTRNDHVNKTIFLRLATEIPRKRISWLKFQVYGVLSSMIKCPGCDGWYFKGNKSNTWNMVCLSPGFARTLFWIRKYKHFEFH